MRVIQIPQELSEYLELLNYETNALQDLLVRMAMFNFTVEVPSELKNYWTDKYIEIYTEYEIAKKELEKKYVQPTLKENETVRWNLNFDSCEVVVQ